MRTRGKLNMLGILSFWRLWYYSF